MAVIDLPHRQLSILDDCYNANPASVQQAILTAQQVRAPGERVIFVLGDMLELGAVSQQRHREIGEMVATLTPVPDVVVTVGHEARLIAVEAERAGLGVHAYAQAEAAAAFIRDTVARYTGAQLILIKGSRGTRLEEVTRRLVEQ
jgi:UDP-N-acetylmuramyl pentapeptide synthase